jgi:hypothetical protein
MTVQLLPASLMTNLGFHNVQPFLGHRVGRKAVVSASLKRARSLARLDLVAASHFNTKSPKVPVFHLRIALRGIQE